MASFITDSEKAELEAVMDDLHDTFARDIVVFKFAAQTVISTDLNYNPYYQNAGQTTPITYTPTSGTYSARIKYIDDVQSQYWSQNTVQRPVKLETPVGTVRIRVDYSGYLFIKDTQRADIDDRRFVIDSVSRAHGLFSNKYYDFIFKPDP